MSDKVLMTEAAVMERGRLLDTSEVADLLRVSTRKIKTLRLRREIGFVRLGRNIRFRQADVTEFLEKHLVEAKR